MLNQFNSRFLVNFNFAKNVWYTISTYLVVVFAIFGGLRQNYELCINFNKFVWFEYKRGVGDNLLYGEPQFGHDLIIQIIGSNFIRIKN